MATYDIDFKRESALRSLEGKPPERRPDLIRHRKAPKVDMVPTWKPTKLENK